MGRERPGNCAGQEVAALYHRGDPLDADQLTRAAYLVEASGARQWAERETAVRLADATDALRAAAPHEQAGADLRDVADLVSRRDS